MIKHVNGTVDVFVASLLQWLASKQVQAETKQKQLKATVFIFGLICIFVEVQKW